MQRALEQLSDGDDAAEGWLSLSASLRALSQGASSEPELQATLQHHTRLLDVLTRALASQSPHVAELDAVYWLGLVLRLPCLARRSADAPSLADSSSPEPAADSESLPATATTLFGPSISA